MEGENKTMSARCLQVPWRYKDVLDCMRETGRYESNDEWAFPLLEYEKERRIRVERDSRQTDTNNITNTKPNWTAIRVGFYVYNDGQLVPCRLNGNWRRQPLGN
jgi:hypothetical protein